MNASTDVSQYFLRQRMHFRGYDETGDSANRENFVEVLKYTTKQNEGQDYDKASNMKSEFNGLRSLTLKENTSAYYIHCFAHRLQLAAVVVAKKHFEVRGFFNMISLFLI